MPDFRTPELPFCLHLPEACEIAGDVARAEQLYDLLAPFADRIACDVDDADSGSVQRPLGILAALLGRRREAVAHLEAAIAENDLLGYRPWAAWSRPGSSRHAAVRYSSSTEMICPTTGTRPRTNG